MRAAIYCRLSDNPGGKSISIATQENDGRSLAETLGATTVAVYTDGDVTAADPTVLRPAFEELLDGVLVGDFDVVIARELSRLARNRTDHDRFLIACQRTNTALYADGHQVDIDTPQGEFVTDTLANVNRLESRLAQVRTTRAMRERAERGLPLSGKAGFGYRKTEDDNYAIVEEEAKVIRDAADAILAGRSLAAVSRAWNASPHKPRRGDRWYPSTVRRVLLAPRTAGLREHRGKIVGKAAWPPILDEVTYARVGRALNDPRRRTSTSRTARLLTGIIECGGCGNTMNHKNTHGAEKYACRHCHARSIRADALEEFVVALVASFFDTSAIADAAAPGVDLAPVLAELDDVKGRITTLAAAWAAGDVDSDEWAAAKAVLAARERALRGKLDGHQAEPLHASYSGHPDLLRERWPLMEHTEQRRLIRSVFRWVRIGPAVQGLGRFDPDRVTFEYVR